MKRITSLLILMSFFILNINTALAEEYDIIYDKGRDHTTEAFGYDMGDSVGIVSVSATYDKSSGGMTYVRVWSRTPKIKEYLDSLYQPTSSGAWVSNVFLTSENIDTSPSFVVYETRPLPSAAPDSIVDEVFYDILGTGIPFSGTVRALTNNFKSSIIETASPSGSGLTIEYRNPDYARDLPLGIYYDNADTVASYVLSGYHTRFWYKLPSSLTKFKLAARGKINYTYRYTILTSTQYITVPTNEFSREYLINNP